MSVAKKYFDIDSTYRDRNSYDNPYDFVIPYSFPNKGDTTLSFIDPILKSSPYTGSTTKKPGELLTGVSISSTSITFDIEDIGIDNYYIDSTLQIGGEFRNIIKYIGYSRTAIIDNPFAIIPPSGTIYYVRKIKNYFNSDVSIVDYDINTNSVYSLNLISGNVSPVRDFYKGSYIRFTNGPHVDETALISSYIPNGEIICWSQPSAPGSISRLSTVQTYGYIVPIGSPNILDRVIITLSSLETVGLSRDILFEIRNGRDINGSIVYTTTFSISNTTVIDYLFSFTGSGVVLQTGFYTFCLQDISSGGVTTGYVDIYGVDSSSTYTSINTPTYPKIFVSSYLLTGILDYSQPTNTNASSYVPTDSEWGIVFTPTKRGVVEYLTILLRSFESVSSGRSLLITLRRGDGFSGTILYTYTFTAPNTSSPTDTTIFLPQSVFLDEFSTYTLSLKDTTTGGINTGFIHIFGISPSIPTYKTYNISVYPKLSFISSYIKDNVIFQQGSKFIPSGYVGNPYFGSSISLNANGNTLVVGGYGDDTNTGAVWVYTRNTNTWTQEGGKLIGIASGQNSFQGTSVSISDDGNTIAIGGSIDNEYLGAVWVFTRSGGIWGQQGNKLIGTGYIEKPFQGNSVSLSSDGNILVSGASGDNDGIGAVWVFTRGDGRWGQQGSKLVGTGYIGTNNIFQGMSVCISGDGTTIAVGGSGDNDSVGAVWIFTRSGGVWTQQGSKLVGTGYVGYSLQGSSVSLSTDGNTLVSGGFGDNNAIGAVWVFTRSGGVWTQQGSKLVGTGYVGLEAYQGSSVSLSGDGNILVSGGCYDNSNVGATWIFVRNGTTWSQQGVKIVGSGYIAGNVLQGYSASISRGGNVLAVGGPLDNSNIGSVWVYSASSTSFFQNTNQTIFDQLSTTTEYGYRFSLSSNSMITNLLVNISSFDSTLSYRNILLRIRSGSGTGGTIVYSNTYNIQNISPTNDYNFTSINTILTAGTYTITLIDTTPGGNSTGNIFIYGITPNGTYVSYNSSIVYPKFSTFASSLTLVFSQLQNQSLSTTISTISENGYVITPSTSGFLSKVVISLDSFDSTGSRDLQIRIRNGSGLSGTILYAGVFSIQNTSKTDYTFSIDLSLAPSVFSGSKYTVTLQDMSVSSGSINLYGINPSSTYQTYNLTVYPKTAVYIPSFLVTIYPPAKYDGFLADNTDNIEFNTVANENATTLFYNGLNSRTSFYKVGLEYIVLPNKLLKNSLGGKLDTYPYVYVQLFNEGNQGSFKTIISNNPNSIFALFKVAVDKYLYDIPTSFFTLKPKNREQIIALRPDKNIRFRVTLPDGTILVNNDADNLTPDFPNPFLQVNALFTIQPVD